MGRGWRRMSTERTTRRWTAGELLDLVLDEGTFTSWDEPIDLSYAEPDYRATLTAAAEKAGTDESVLTGRGEVRGRPVAVVVNEFRFLAGSIGRAAADLAGHGPPGALEGVHPDDRREQRRPDDLPLAGRVPLVERGEHAVGAVHPGQQVGDGYADALRVVGTGPGERHQPGLALGDLVVAGTSALGSVVAEAGDREDDEARVAAHQLLDAEAEALEDAGAEVLHQHVGALDEADQDVLVGLVLEVEGDGLLVAVRAQEVRRLAGVGLADERRPPAAGVVAAAGRLHLDHPGAEVAQHLGGVRPGEGAGQVDYEEVGQGSGHVQLHRQVVLVRTAGRARPGGRPRAGRARRSPRGRSPPGWRPSGRSARPCRPGP